MKTILTMNKQPEKTSTLKKGYIPDQESSKIIMNYFLYNNFQDFNTWQQIAKTRIDYKFHELSKEQSNREANTPGQEITCELILKFETQDKTQIPIKTTARNKRIAKRKALTALIQEIMAKGLIGCGFREKNFVEKLPRRKRYDSEDSEEENYGNSAEMNTNKRGTVNNIIKQLTYQKVIDNVTTENAIELWSYILHQRNLEMCEGFLNKLLCINKVRRQTTKIKQEMMIEEREMRESEDNQTKQRQSKQMQVSYVEQFKDPFEEDLTVFIRYYQLQRPKYQQKRFNLLQVKSENGVKIKLPCSTLAKMDPLRFQDFRDFVTVEQVSEMISKGSMKGKQSTEKKVNDFWKDEREFKAPKFQQDAGEEKVYSWKMVDKLYDSILFCCDDYNFGVRVLEMLRQTINLINFIDVSYAKRAFTSTNQSPSQSYLKQITSSSQQYYLQMKHNLLQQMLYNLGFKHQSILKTPSLTLEGTLSHGMGQSRHQSVFEFKSWQPEEILARKVSKKNNWSEFYEMMEICSEEVVVVVDKLARKEYVGLVKEVGQGVRLSVPGLGWGVQEKDMPLPVTVYKLLNAKLYYRLSAALIHACKYYQNYLKPSNSYINSISGTFPTASANTPHLIPTIILTSPSTPTHSLLLQLVSQLLSKKLFTLIISQNFEVLHKFLQLQGFSALKVTPACDQKLVHKSNLILCSPFGACSELMKTVAFDRVVIDEANRVPEVISLAAIVKNIKKVYLIGDGRLPRVQMRSQGVRKNNGERSMLEKYLQMGEKYIMVDIQQENSSMNTISTKPEISFQQNEIRVYDSQIVQWLATSIYFPSQLLTQLNNPLFRRTPLIKGFNWPSPFYRLCFIHTPSQMTQKNLKNTITQDNQDSNSLLVNSQCFLAAWIVAEVIKSGFTELQQISCCCFDSKVSKVMQQYLIKILQKCNIQPMKWGVLMQRLLMPLTGSRFQGNDLLIVMAEVVQMNECDVKEGQGKMGKIKQDKGKKGDNGYHSRIEEQNKHKKDQKSEEQERINKDEDDLLLRKLVAALLQAQRGLIIIGEIDKLCNKSQGFSNFISWLGSKRLIVQYNPPKQ